KACSGSGIFTEPHHTSPRESASSTMRLSLGLRPVLAPDRDTSAPDELIRPPSCSTASSYSRAGAVLRTTSATRRPGRCILNSDLPLPPSPWPVMTPDFISLSFISASRCGGRDLAVASDRSEHFLHRNHTQKGRNAVEQLRVRL